ncbi:hypothetical protein Mterra_01457 [Calidithermus terrae]|uniref:Uncharacterized protein n=1 Tax=Calidithermus terrae TaxID=1408545 RepID=A0A399EUM5_9DEIN|nr:hypothetical protein Mterra_01457 [Calidithermus terrae]
MEAHQRVHVGLRVDQHLHLLQRQAEELHGLEHLEALVEQRRGVDGHLGPHLPARVAQGHLGGDVAQVGGLVQEGAAGGGEDELGHAGKGLAGQALEEGGVLGVHREDFRPAPLGLGPQQRPGRHHALLIGQRHAPPGPHRRPHPGEPREAGDSPYHHVGGVGGDLLDGGELEPGEAAAQLGVQRLVGGHGLGLELFDLGREGLEVAPCRQPHHAVAPPAADLEGLGADGAGGAQHDYTFVRRSFGHRPKVYPKARDADRLGGCS